MAEKAASNKEHPLAGVVLCFTSILPEQRSELASIAGQMGATHKLDLTSDVTHLLVGETNTPKYKFVARERTDVVVLKPEWVEAVRQSWMQGGDTDIHALEEQYKLPTFMGLSICITGFEDMAFRNYIQNSAISHGADFSKDLTKNITHLVARSTEGEKYKFATQWNIKVVTIRWFTESIERGMILEETLYHPLLPPEKQGLGAWNRSQVVVKSKPSENESSNPRPRKLRRIASAKLESQNSGIWGDIVGAGFEPSDIGGPSESQQKPNGRPVAGPISVIQEAKSFASETTFAEVQESRPQSSQAAATSRAGFLEDCYFLIHGFSSKQTNVLRHHLSFNGAQLVDSMSEFSRPDIPKKGQGLYIIVPYKTPRNKAPSTDDLAFECEVVTDMWLERCLDAKAFVSPESHIANTPIPCFPIKGFSELKLCSTGFSRIDLLHLSKLVALIGAKYDEYLTPKASVLLCNVSVPVNNEKLRHTNEWGVPAVTSEWLWSSIRMEKKQPFEPYLVRKSSTQNSKDLELRAGSRPEQKKRPIHNNKTSPTQQPLDHEAANANGGSTTPLDEGESSRRGSGNKTSQTRETNTQPQEFLAPESKPTSPMKAPDLNKTKSPSTGPKLAEQQLATPTIDLTAVSGFLKQARAASSRPTTEAGEAPDRFRARRTRPLFGRVQSNSSTRHTTVEHNVISRASSIDTLNEDGCGSAIESVNTDGIPSLVNSGRYEYPEGDRFNADNEHETPQMTQLDYEDPDAVAMREKFLRGAGKLVDKPSNKQDAVIGEVQELEDGGWGNGRRTRKANKTTELEDDFWT